MKIGYVYWIHHENQLDPTEHGYIGVSNDPKRRLREHKNSSGNLLLKEAFEKDSNIKMDILFIGSYECTLMREKCFRPKRNIGWNINSGGKVPPDATGKVRSEETRRKISLNNVGFKGRKHSQETKEKMSMTHQNIPGKPHTEETKRKLSEITKTRRNTQTKENL